MRKKNNIYAEQYVEVARNKNDEWDVEIVIETINKKNPATREHLATFNTEEEGERLAEALRIKHNITIFEYELM